MASIAESCIEHQIGIGLYCEFKPCRRMLRAQYQISHYTRTTAPAVNLRPKRIPLLRRVCTVTAELVAPGGVEVFGRRRGYVDA